MAAEKLEPIELDDADVDYDEYVGVLRGSVESHSERILAAYDDLETEFVEQFEAAVDDEPNRLVRNTEATEEFRESLAETFEGDLYSTWSKAGEEDIGSYADFQEAMRSLAELNYVRLLEQLEEARHRVADTRNDSSNAVSLLNQAGELLTEKGFTHKTKEPITQRLDTGKEKLKDSAQLRREASVSLKRCYFHFFTAELVIEKYGLDTTEFRYVDVEQPIEKRLTRLRDEFMRQARRIKKGRRSLQTKVEYIKKNANLE